MAGDEAREFAAAKNALVVAAAGCGKTELIARAVGSDDRGRQLVLTHTHAGVRVLRQRLLEKGIPTKRFVVDTIDGWALRYARNYPALSGLGDRVPPDADWREIREAAQKALHRRAIRDVVARSYTGLYVDEYQDCSNSQHALICTLGDILRCRIVGDPLQGIFDFDDEAPAQGFLFDSRDPRPDWQSDVEQRFRRIGELQTLHRWNTQNPELGAWLKNARTCLEAGTEIDLDNGSITWERVSDPGQRRIAALKACRSVAKGETDHVVAIRHQPNLCFALGKHLGGQYRCAERTDVPDLFTWISKIEQLRGPERAAGVIEFATCCVTKVPDILRSLRKTFLAGKEPGARQARKYPALKDALLAVARDDDLLLVKVALPPIIDACGVKQFYRMALWSALRQTFETHDPSSGVPIHETAWRVCDRSRRYGRRLSRCLIGTTWLVKGLEFEHTIVVDADDEQVDAKNLYVAMTRASKSLTILSASSRIRKAPALPTQP